MSDLRTESLRAFINERLDDRTKTLLRLAWWDLYWGPFYSDNPPEPDAGWEEWPGFRLAINEINGGLVNLPRTLYFDSDAHLVIEDAPEGWWEHDPEHPDADEDGDVFYEPDRASILQLEWDDIKRLLWTDLAPYLE
jgi:hypothetical protein